MISRHLFRLIPKLMFLMTLLLPLGVHAEHKIYFNGSLAGNKVVIKVNGHNRILARGQKSKEGIEVLSFNRNEVIVRVHGKRYRYKKRSKKGIALEDEVTIPFTDVPAIGLSGYYVSGFINGKKTGFLVDTGATDVALTLKDAKRLNIRLHKKDRIDVGLAGGIKGEGWRTTLDSVRLGDIEIKNVSAIVIKSRQNVNVLLGMSFLKKLEFRQSKDKMILRYTPP
jgi:aspartyl protease family protein